MLMIGLTGPTGAGKGAFSRYLAKGQKGRAEAHFVSCNGRDDEPRQPQARAKGSFGGAST